MENQLDRKVSSFPALVKDLKMQTEEDLKGLAYTRIQGNPSGGALLFIFKITKKSALDEDALRELGQNSEKVAACSADILEKIPEADRDGCVIVLSHQVSVAVRERQAGHTGPGRKRVQRDRNRG